MVLPSKCPWVLAIHGPKIGSRQYTRQHTETRPTKPVHERLYRDGRIFGTPRCRVKQTDGYIHRWICLGRRMDEQLLAHKQPDGCTGRHYQRQKEQYIRTAYMCGVS